MTLIAEGVKKSYNNRLVLKDINLLVEPHEFVCILGNSGGGKSTLLNLLAGFIKPDEGDIKVNGTKITRPSKERGVVFQDHALFPWYTVIENIAFGPIVQGVPKQEALKKAINYLELISLVEYAHHYPTQLSGGMKQRVGIARALAGEPEILLMDEPFGALDLFTRENMRSELTRIWKELKPTIIFITHDIAEAIYLADRIIVIKNGVVAAEIPINLPRPRNYHDPEFGKLMEEIGENFMN
ncbi:nitrate/sulfonate/bicarbonate ABC transporter ATP-binding protein [Bacillus methanolicus PB1]|uniref:Carnitine transport ATP-binding protein OpuCA n=1 Tax=Bacillus methanolicus PB1 TaxID=997296 RepID=I3E1R4_BACMT|nr:ABC transporter ATP-binding protein [Bacillus methanolicus]EIJ80435.1 nitrate/sulfonate/bicarbonate ABC transporter ATP-binding protein [Bacillus methanolicus PB1]